MKYMSGTSRAAAKDDLRHRSSRTGIVLTATRIAVTTTKPQVAKTRPPSVAAISVSMCRDCRCGQAPSETAFELIQAHTTGAYSAR
jgi:hypothetical protein